MPRKRALKLVFARARAKTLRIWYAGELARLRAVNQHDLALALHESGALTRARYP
jgi:hypothetical protein